MSTALITGASSGIGEAFARRVAADGSDLFLVARSGEKLAEICKQLSEKHGIKADFLAVDLTDGDAVTRIFAETERLGREIDLLINNAGFGSMGDFAKLDRERELSMIDLNVRALVEMTHTYLPQMRGAGTGTIVNVSSAASFQPVPYMATYAASKAFVTSFSEAVAAENRPYGIQVLALCPGSTETNFFDAAKMDRAFKAKGQQTAEQVVGSGMRAIGSGRAKVVSGWSNWLVASAVNFVPNSLITKVIAKGLRKRFEE